MSRRAGPARPIVAVLGGTFDGLHAGHRRLLEVAFAAADQVGIGLTTFRYLGAHPKSFPRKIRAYAARRRRLGVYLRTTFPGRRWWIVPLDEPWGRSVEPGYDVLVASIETAKGARAVNAERRRRGLPPLKVVLVPLVRGDDRLPISSSRIRGGRIDPDGHRRGPIRFEHRGVPLGPTERAALGRLWPGLEIRFVRAPAAGAEYSLRISSPGARGRSRYRWSLVGEDGSHVSGSLPRRRGRPIALDRIVSSVRTKWTRAQTN